MVHLESPSEPSYPTPTSPPPFRDDHEARMSIHPLEHEASQAPLQRQQQGSHSPPKSIDRSTSTVGTASSFTPSHPITTSPPLNVHATPASHSSMSTSSTAAKEAMLASYDATRDVDTSSASAPVIKSETPADDDEETRSIIPSTNGTTSYANSSAAAASHLPSPAPVASTSGSMSPPPLVKRSRSLSKKPIIKAEDDDDDDHEGSESAAMDEQDSDDDDTKGFADDDEKEYEEEEEEYIVKPKRKTKKDQPVFEPQLIPDLPLAEDEAARTYVEIPDCTYANKTLGNLAYFDEDSTRCECTYTPGFPDSEQACGDESHCVNRLMQIECLADDCRCGNRCQNQRFQEKQYAPIEIVKTPKKGFGVRVVQDMAADTFVYEYVGEVIGPTLFAKRMKDYGNEGVRHFYFMALDKEIFIDATKRGGKGRFLNHSCNPNCFVAKWTIGKKMRMGIFTKRAVRANEELTFNYNVDRYGHVAQECFCGEPNCVGFIGGKTQTDIGGMDDLYLDALGIAEEVEALGLRGTKRKKGKKLDEDFLPSLRPIQLDEVPKVSAAVRQSIQTRRILEKLMTRIQMTDDPEVLSALLRLHGFNLMTHILKEYPSDLRVIALDLEILTKWPLMTRNKVESSKIEECVRECVKIEESNIRAMATNLLDYWDSLELGYRIPRAVRTETSSNVNANEGEASASNSNGAGGQAVEGGSSTPANERKRFLAGEYSIEQIAKRARAAEESIETPRRPTWVKPSASIVRPPSPTLPRGWKKHRDEAGKSYYENTHTREVQWTLPTQHVEPSPSPSSASSTAHHRHHPQGPQGHPPSTTTTTRPSQPVKSKPIDVNEIIAQVQKEAEAVAAREEKERQRKEQEAREVAEQDRLKKRSSSLNSSSRKSSSSSGLGSGPTGAMAAKDKKVMALFSSIVVQVMSKYKGFLDPDQFKKRAKEVTILLCEKEKKHPSYAKEPYDSLSADKASKIKAFTKDWIKKLIERKRLQNHSSSSSTPGAAGSVTPALALDSPSPSTPLTGKMSIGLDSPVPPPLGSGKYSPRSEERSSGIPSNASSVNGGMSGAASVTGRIGEDSPGTPPKR